MNINDAIDNVKQDIKEAKKEAFDMLLQHEDFLIMIRVRLSHNVQNIIPDNTSERIMKLVLQLKKVEALDQKLSTLEDCSY